MEPCERRRVATKCVAGPQRAKKRLLDDIFGLVADVARRDGVQLTPGPFVLLQHGFLHRRPPW
jgi:hypothetical protein